MNGNYAAALATLALINAAIAQTKNKNAAGCCSWRLGY